MKINRSLPLLIAAVAGIWVVTGVSSAATGPCAAPSTDYGTVANSVNINGSGVYRIWSRVAIPASSTSAYSIEVDGSNCFPVSGATLPIYASNSSTFFGSTSTNWTGNSVGGAPITLNLNSGAHSVKLIGTSDGVLVDRLILTQDTSCIPTGTGTNCSAPPDTTAPVVALTAPAANATIGASTVINATATDDTAVTKVDFYADSTLVGSDVTNNNDVFTVTFNSSTLTAGTHLLKAVASDAAGNTTTSSTVSVTVPGSGGGTNPTYPNEDINKDGSVNYLDLSILASNYGKSGTAITIPRADVNSDGTINYLDLSLVANKYGK